MRRTLDRLYTASMVAAAFLLLTLAGWRMAARKAGRAIRNEMPAFSPDSPAQ